MNPIAIWFHTLFQLDQEILPAALSIVHEQMSLLKESGLQDLASEIHVGVNGGPESLVYCTSLLPEKSKVYLNGLQCKNELRTIRRLEEWLPGHDDWYVLYVHAKGCTHPPGDPLRTAWRECFMQHLVKEWPACLTWLRIGYDCVGCHWMTPPQTPPTQYIFAGNMWWAKVSFLKTLPSMLERDRIKKSGIDSLESRYEAEVFLCNGPRLPVIKDCCPGWQPGKAHL